MMIAKAKQLSPPSPDRTCPGSYPRLKATELKLRGEHNFALGFSTNQGENFQDYHGKHVLIIADEALGIESGIWEAIAGIMAGGQVHTVMAGNPTLPAGVFFEALLPDEPVGTRSPSAFDGSRSGGPLDDNPYSYLVTRRWIYEQHFAWWHGSESSSPNWLVYRGGGAPSGTSKSISAALLQL
jgi:hypothetical protein